MTYELDPLTGDPMPKSSVIATPSETPPQTPQIDPTALEGLTRDELIALVKIMPGWPVALMSEDEQAEAMFTRLAIEGLDPKGKQWQTAISQWFDRKRGKPVTPVAAAIVVKDDKPLDRRELARQVDFLLAIARNSDAPVIEGSSE